MSNQDLALACPLLLPCAADAVRFVTAVVTHLLGCIFLYMGENMKGGWLDRGFDYAASRDAPVPDQYLLCTFYVLATLSSEGNVGELVPETMLEMVFCLLLMIISTTLFIYVLGEISSLVMKMDDEVCPLFALSFSVSFSSFISSSLPLCRDPSLFQSVRPSLHLSIFLPVCLTFPVDLVYLSISPSIHPSFNPSIPPSTSRDCIGSRLMPLDLGLTGTR